jgi:hypothetical protein
VWTAYDVGFPPWTLTLKADGAKLSGTVQQGARGSSGYNTTLTMPAAIYDGEIYGNKITFKCQDPWSHDRTITFTGIVNRDEITFTRSVLVKPGGRPGSNGIFGAAGAAEFTAQRVVPSGAASVPAEPDQRRAMTGHITGAVGTNRYVNDKTSPYYQGPDSHGRVGHADAPVGDAVTGGVSNQLQGYRYLNSVSLCPPPHFRMTERDGCQPVR